MISDEFRGRLYDESWEPGTIPAFFASRMKRGARYLNERTLEAEFRAEVGHGINHDAVLQMMHSQPRLGIHHMWRELLNQDS